MKAYNHIRVLLCGLSLALALSACERLGLEDPAKSAANKEAEGKATGAACRHAGRGLEDCYQQNPKALRAAVFIGWKEMNDYMTQNKIEVIPPPPPPPPPPPVASAEEGKDADAKDDKSAKDEKKASKH